MKGVSFDVEYIIHKQCRVGDFFRVKNLVLTERKELVDISPVAL